MTREPICAEAATGTCLCGQVSVTLHRVACAIDVCHCAMCLRWSGAAFAGVKADAFDLSGSEFIATYRSSDWAERTFCSVCGSHLWFRFIPGDHHSFMAGLFSLPENTAMEKQIFVDEKPHWYDFVQETQMRTGPEIIAEAKAAGFDFS